MSGEDLTNLNKIEHIVVLMMENRSFDHLLGYLALEGGRTDVDGLTSDMFNISTNGTVHRIHHLENTTFELDPCHEGNGVDEQISNNNGGFVLNFERMCRPVDPGGVMGYHNAADLPVYDHLAREFTICDRWFSSTPGETWPNRLYALTGHSDGSRDNRSLPLYNEPSFVRHLDAGDISWRWYSHDYPTLRLADRSYRAGHINHFFSFRRVFALENDFFSHAATGKLAAVSWIDPNFASIGSLSNANDDHAPADLRAGQTLVNEIYQALLNSPAWEKVLLIIVYDEHGGFYDHVPPPFAVDDAPNFRRYGCRVPAFIVSPWVKRSGVSHTLFDHTSIIKTILLRFCRQSNGTIPDMGARVAAANHLGELLTERSPRLAPVASELQQLHDSIAHHEEVDLIAQDQQATPKLNKFQRGLLTCRRELTTG